jgi:undecaprenyl-diphosphatase
LQLLRRILGGVKRRRGTVTVIVLIVGLVLGFAALASEVLEAETDWIDHAILEALRSADGKDPVGPPWFERTMVNLSALGSVAVATLVVIVTCGFLLLVRRPRQAALVIFCALGTALAVELLKAFVGRERPSVVVAIDLAHGLSFPSGHTMIASALYPTIGLLLASSLKHYRLKAFVFATAALLALLIGFTRMYLGVHYPTDVAAGWLLGLAWALTCGLIASWLQLHRMVEQESEVAGERPAG